MVGKRPLRATRRPGTSLLLTGRVPDGRVLVLPWSISLCFPQGTKGSLLDLLWEGFGTCTQDGVGMPPPPPGPVTSSVPAESLPPLGAWCTWRWR